MMLTVRQENRRFREVAGLGGDDEGKTVVSFAVFITEDRSTVASVQSVTAILDASLGNDASTLGTSFCAALIS